MKGFIPGPMVEDMKDNMRWIRNTASASITGLMDVFMKDYGKTESNMVKGNTFYKMELSKSVNGSMGRELIG